MWFKHKLTEKELPENVICISAKGYEIHQTLNDDPMEDIDEAFDRVGTALALVHKHFKKNYNGVFMSLLDDLHGLMEKTHDDFDAIRTAMEELHCDDRLTAEEVADREYPDPDDVYDHMRAIGG